MNGITVIQDNLKKEGALLSKVCHEQKAIPKQCPYCDSKNIVCDNTENIWECKDCTAYFDWKHFKVLYLIEVDIECPSDEMELWAGDLIDEGEIEMLGYWEDGKHETQVRFTKEEIQ